MDALSTLLTLPRVDQDRIGVLHTAKEIAQQPDTWWRTYETIKSLQPELQTFLNAAGVFNREVDHRPTVFLVGAGTSDYVGKSVADVLRRLWQCDVWSVPSTDLLNTSEDLHLDGKRYLWISFSRSGDSSEGVAVLESALEHHPEISQLVVCCNESGRMARIAKDAPNVVGIVLDDQVNDKGLAMTSSYSNMVIAAQCLAHIQDLETYSQTLTSLIATARNILPRSADLASQLVKTGFSRICFLGTGAIHGVAIESALKVTELTAGRIVSFSESFLGVRHGPLSAIDKQTLVVGFVSSDPLRRAYELDLLQEIKDKKLGMSTILLTPKIDSQDSERLQNIGQVFDFDSSLSDLYRPPVDVITGQLLGLFASLNSGLKPDEPSPQGAISRVVSKVRIH
jgi:tagatose-6-phosphate ketose/aldose isomerase